MIKKIIICLCVLITNGLVTFLLIFHEAIWYDSPILIRVDSLDKWISVVNKNLREFNTWFCIEMILVGLGLFLINRYLLKIISKRYNIIGLLLLIVFLTGDGFVLRSMSNDYYKYKVQLYNYTSTIR